ncbi:MULTISPECIES: hypothetical protein [unclassified Arenibacter]|jgi:hypothetical protein|uniref:hypothetical protein n=1 Tax=unclassified Arenibacter TaxID=2615047 RepID=UPI000E3442B1|nr:MULTISPECIES: hypothetical protein [unclassified Arenibacter]MCM4163635.1 hypothetical protein [Arenibacter sp. A80]RFT56362.1 hypothetical protein D0S24_08495 [Arenibacter sp. P308M17]
MKILITILFVMVLHNGFVSSEPFIKNKGHIIFTEDFEKASLKEVLPNWDDHKNAAGMSLSTDVPKGSTGKKSLMMTYEAGKDEGAHLFKNFPEGHEVLYARFYIKFLTNNSHVHHLVKLGGYQPAVPYPLGLAGRRPNGTDFFMSGIELPDNVDWNWGFYTYWMHMEGRPDNYWGNVFFPVKEKAIPIGKWICVEFMIKLNSPFDSFNGEQAFWIDGEKILHLGEGFPKMVRKGGHFKEDYTGKAFPGYQWRNNDQLKLTLFWLNYYMTKGKKGQIDQILFDDIVVSNEYIGPLKRS